MTWRIRLASLTTQRNRRVLDEVLTDLLAPDNKECRVALDPHRGNAVVGAERRTLRTAADARDAVRRARPARKTVTLPAGPAGDSTAAVFEFEVSSSNDLSHKGSHLLTTTM